jgi:hypothetical protein
MATVLCPDDHGVYRYLTERIAKLDGVSGVEVVLIIRSVKRAAMMVPPTSAAA